VTTRQLRLLRGAAAATVATIIAAVSHTLGGGAAPHPLLVAALSVFLTPLAALLVGSRPSLARLSAAVLVAQGVFHVLFVALNATADPTVAGTGHQHTLVLAPIGDSASPIATSSIATDAGMLGAHVVAGILTIALLWRGESMLRAIARWVRAVLHSRAPRIHPAWPTPPSVAGTARVVIPLFDIGDVCRRGPPALSRA